MQQTSPVWKWLWNEGGKDLPPSEYEGDIAAFDNPGYTYPKDIAIAIEPVQDLHGYDNPWPAGGGKNLLDKDAISRGGYYDPINGNKTGGSNEFYSDFIPVEEGQTLTANKVKTLANNGTETTFFSSWTYWDSNKQFVSGTWNGTNTSVVPQGASYLVLSSSHGVGSATIDFSQEVYDAFLADYIIAVGSETPTFEPYSNVCPITGWTGCNIKRTNSNLADNDYFANLSNYHASTGGYSYVEYFLRAGTYTISFAKQTSGGYARIGQSFFLIKGRPYSYTFTLEKDQNLKIYLNAYSEETLSRYFVDGNGIIITAGSTIGTFEPTATSTNRIPFPSEVGTVYGGTLGVTTGLLTVTHGNIASYNGESLPGKWISSMDVYSAGGTPTTGAQIVYELATPQTYQLSPTEVALLLGVNNVWADTGETTVALESPGHMHLETRATIGGTAYSDISAPVITRALMQDQLSVGNVVSASLALAVRGAVNIPRSAAVVVEVRLNDGQTASEWLPQGTFYISRRMRDPVTGLLALECYDALLKANAVWTPSAGAWPRTMAAVTAELAALLGVTLDSRTVIPTGAVYVMAEPAEGTTIRDALSVVAQAAGGNWVMTPTGLLRLVRVGESGGTVDVTGVVGGIDVGQAGTVTGVRSTVDGVVTLIGDDTGIVVDVSIAPMIAAEMAEDLIGQAYAPFHLSGAIYDPAAELGDGVRADAGGEVISALCSEQATYGPAFRGDIAAPDPGEVTDEYPYIGSAERTLALAKATAIEAVDRLDDALTQQEIFNRLTDNGAAQGLVLYNGQLYINASYINAGYLNANRIHGGVLTLGGDGNINGWLSVLNEDNTAVVTIDSTGIEINNNNNTLTSNGYWSHTTYLTPYYPQNYEGRVLISDYAESDTERRQAYFAPIEIGLKRMVNNVSYNSAAFSLNGINIQKFDRQPDQSMQATRAFLVDLYNHELHFTGDATIGGALSVGDAATTRANLGITPANIGAVAKSGDTMTGTLCVNRTSDGGEADVEAKSAAGTIYLYSMGSNTGNRGIYASNAAGTGKGVITIDQNNNITCNGNAVNVTGTVQVDHGGTGATTAAVTITNNYSSVLNAINAVRDTRIFPISIQKNGTSSYSDMPSGYETKEWNMLLIGDQTRLSATLYIFNAANNPIYVRQFVSDHWLYDWVQIN